MGIWFGVGLSDELLPDNRKLSAQMKALGIEHTYHEAPGGHDGQYGNGAFQECMKKQIVRLAELFHFVLQKRIIQMQIKETETML